MGGAGGKKKTNRKKSLASAKKDTVVLTDPHVSTGYICMTPSHEILPQIEIDGITKDI